MPAGQCRLCHIESNLRESHVLPKFVYRGVMNGGAGGRYFRDSKEPNKRNQDGWKRYWLCANCEKQLSVFESSFSSQLFSPYTSGKSTSLPYAEWLLPFCISVSWRVLHFYKERGALKSYDLTAVGRVDEAEGTWRDFLLGRRTDVGPFVQYLFPLLPVTRIVGPKEHVSPNINRYFLRAIAMDLISGPGYNFTYSKLGRLVIFGFIEDNKVDAL